jgi:putative aminopeptidase FrvX
MLQHTDLPFDWCFIGAPEDHVHSPNEKVHLNDIKAMTDLYSFLMQKL